MKSCNPPATVNLLIRTLQVVLLCVRHSQNMRRSHSFTYHSIGKLCVFHPQNKYKWLIDWLVFDANVSNISAIWWRQYKCDVCIRHDILLTYPDLQFRLELLLLLFWLIYCITFAHCRCQLYWNVYASSESLWIDVWLYRNNSDSTYYSILLGADDRKLYSIHNQFP